MVVVDTHVLVFRSFQSLEPSFAADVNALRRTTRMMFEGVPAGHNSGLLVTTIDGSRPYGDRCSPRGTVVSSGSSGGAIGR